MTGELIIKSAAEIMAEPPEPRQWGGWKLKKSTYELEYFPYAKGETGAAYSYSVDLERCTTSAQMLDWIMQIAGKTWANDVCLAGLVRALDDVLAPQGTLCSFGKSKTLTEAAIRKHVKGTKVR